jgi:chemotaxis signal transduction protein/CheY-like chemotaxis protein
MSFDPQKIRILLVEDSALMRTIQVKTLFSLGFNNIIEAEDGREAVHKLEEEEGIDLIISDWNMPNMDGLELLIQVRESSRFKDLPFLMATGQGNMKQEQKAIDAGVSSFVAKPFNADELRGKIEEAFGIKVVEDELPPEERIPKKTSSGKVKMRLAHIQITDHLVLGVLNHLIQKGEMTPKYFDLEIQCMPGWNPVKHALERGTVDGACVLAPIAMDLFSYGAPIKLVLLAHRSGSIFVRNRKGIYTEPFQNFFRHKAFFIPHQMSVHHMLAHMFFKKLGLRAGTVGEDAYDVTFEVVDPIKMPEFLRGNKDACGFMVAEPLGTKAIATGIAELQFLSHELWQNHPCCVVAMRDDFIGPCEDAVYELTELLVEAGKIVSKKPETAAEIAVSFLDPNKILGLKVPLLKNVLTEQQGIKTTNLYPHVEDLDQIQQYMFNAMGIGTMIDLEKFIDQRFANNACRDRISSNQPSKISDSPEVVVEILHRGVIEEIKTHKAMLNKEGKYLTFALGNQEFGIDILKIKEIIGMMPIRDIPQAPHFVKGVINLRGKVIPVMDLRLKFGMEEIDYTDRSCIIILEFEINDGVSYMGIAVDSVSEVLEIKASEIEETPSFGMNMNTNHILAMAKMKEGVKILLDIDQVLDCKKQPEIVDVIL